MDFFEKSSACELAFYTARALPRRMASTRKPWENEFNLTDLMVDAMIDRDGYRPNVAIVLCNTRNQVFWGKRVKEHAWRWHDYWVPLEAVIDFKREVYRLGLEQLSGYLEMAPRVIGLSPYGRRRRHPRGLRVAQPVKPPTAAAES